MPEVVTDMPEVVTDIPGAIVPTLLETDAFRIYKISQYEYDPSDMEQVMVTSEFVFTTNGPIGTSITMHY